MPEDLASGNSITAVLAVESVGGLIFSFRTVCDRPK